MREEVASGEDAEKRGTSRLGWGKRRGCREHFLTLGAGKKSGSKLLALQRAGLKPGPYKEKSERDG